jgi:hypothetical protein
LSGVLTGFGAAGLLAAVGFEAPASAQLIDHLPRSIDVIGTLKSHSYDSICSYFGILLRPSRPHTPGLGAEELADVHPRGLRLLLLLDLLALIWGRHGCDLAAIAACDLVAGN